MWSNVASLTTMFQHRPFSHVFISFNTKVMISVLTCFFVSSWNFFLLYRYWWNTRIFPSTKKSHLHRAQWRYYFYLSRVRILVSPWLLTLILTFWNRKYKYYCLYFSFITLYPSFITFLWQAFCDRWPPTLIALFCCSKMNLKKVVFYVWNFITIYKINRTLHGRLGIRILSSRFESISHSKIKFVSPRDHVISSIFSMPAHINFALVKHETHGGSKTNILRSLLCS